MTYENKVYDTWKNATRGMIIDYHERFADRVISCLGNWLDGLEECEIYSIEDVLSDIKYHRRQIECLMAEDMKRERYNR